MIRFALVALVWLGSIANAQEAQKFNSWDEACAAASSVVAEGDIIFLDIPDFVFRRVAAGTKSWTSHVGIVFKDSAGNWVVDESTIPLSHETPLCDYLKQSAEYTYEIRRLKDRVLTPAEITTMHAKATSMLGKFYMLGFDFDSTRLFCSKLVYLTYQSIGIEAGKLQTFKELLDENPEVSLTFWKVWFLGSIPWERRTVTPASQLIDPKFVTVLKSI